MQPFNPFGFPTVDDDEKPNLKTSPGLIKKITDFYHHKYAVGDKVEFNDFGKRKYSVSFNGTYGEVVEVFDKPFYDPQTDSPVNILIAYARSDTQSRMVMTCTSYLQPYKEKKKIVYFPRLGR